MKAMKMAICALALLLVAGAASAATTGDPPDWTTGSMDGRAHDLRVRLGIDRVCIVCHVAHNAPEASKGPIWNHKVNDTTFYRNGATITIGKYSKLCMSCHDGVTALDSYGGNIGTDVLSGGAAFGNDFTNDHPIGVDYASSTIHGLEDVATVASYLEDGKVECGSCHRAHSASIRRPLTNSELCRVCHTQ